MKIQPSSKSEIDQYGDHVVRVVCDKVIAPMTDTMRRLQQAMPFHAKIKTAAPDNGYGQVAYVFCESETEKQKAHLAIEGEQGIANLIDQLRFWLSVRAYSYYELGKTIVPDSSWDRKANELVRLQCIHGADAGTWHNETFEDFRGDTGYHLSVTDSIREDAQELLEEES